MKSMTLEELKLIAGGEIFLSLAPYFSEGVGIDDDPAMLETAQRNQSKLSIDNVRWMRMNADDLKFEAEEFELEKHWQKINRIIETCQTERGIETNKHRELMIMQKPRNQRKAQSKL